MKFNSSAAAEQFLATVHPLVGARNKTVLARSALLLALGETIPPDFHPDDSQGQDLDDQTIIGVDPHDLVHATLNDRAGHTLDEAAYRHALRLHFEYGCLQADKERHEHEHLRILSGGWPSEIREFMTRVGRDALRHEYKFGDQSGRRHQEIAKRAIVLARWVRSVSNGIPENDLEAYMAAHFAFIDAEESGDQYQIEAANEAVAKWQKYG